MANPSMLLENANRLLREGNLRESLAAYQTLVAGGMFAAEGHYGIGYIRFKSGDLETAATEFQRCLKADPAHANATYYLGLIAERSDQPDIARAYYQRTLALNPGHAAALRKVGAVSPLSPGGPKTNVTVDTLPDSTHQPVLPHSVATKASKPDASAPGFYSALRADPSPIARQALALIDDLEMTTRPRLTAYLGRIVVFSLVPVLGWICLLVLMLIVKTRRITFDQGRVQISRGVFQKHVSNIELYRVIDIAVSQTFWNRMTGDGTLILSVEHLGKATYQVELRGLAKGDKLNDISTKLRSLVLLLRSGNWGKGIIY